MCFFCVFQGIRHQANTSVNHFTLDNNPGDQDLHDLRDSAIEKYKSILKRVAGVQSEQQPKGSVGKAFLRTDVAEEIVKQFSEVRHFCSYCMMAQTVVPANINQKWWLIQDKREAVKQYFMLNRFLLFLMSKRKYNREDLIDLRKVTYHLAILLAKEFTGYSSSHYLHKALAHTEEVNKTIWPLSYSMIFNDWN